MRLNKLITFIDAKAEEETIIETKIDPDYKDKSKNNKATKTKQNRRRSTRKKINNILQ